MGARFDKNGYIQEKGVRSRMTSVLNDTVNQDNIRIEDEQPLRKHFS